MRHLINRLNDMVTRVAALDPNVHHVNLTGTLARAYGDDYKKLWNNELHPTRPASTCSQWRSRRS